MSGVLKDVRKKKDTQQKRMPRGKEIKPELRDIAIFWLLDRKRKTKTEISKSSWNYKLIAEGAEGAIKKSEDDLTKVEIKKATAHMSHIFKELEEEGILKVEIEKPPGQGSAVHWCSLREDFDAFLKVALYRRGKGTLPSLEFLNTPYAQFMINESLLEYLHLSVKDEHKEKLLLMLKLSSNVFYRIIELPLHRKQKREKILKALKEAENREEIIKSIIPDVYTFSDKDIIDYEYEFFWDLTFNQFDFGNLKTQYLYRDSSLVYRKLPVEQIVKVFNLESDAEGRYVRTITTSSTFLIGKCIKFMPWRSDKIPEDTENSDNEWCIKSQ